MKELNKKKYVTLITIIILVMGIIGIINVGNIDLDKGKVKLKSASIEKLKSSVIESKGYEEITYPVLYELEKVDGIEERTVIIKGTLTKEENKYARFKEITSNNITSTVSENGRKIEIKIEKVKLGRQNKINLKIEINGAINETKIKPEIEIKEVSEKEYIKVKTEEIEVKTNSVTGLVQDEEGMSVSNLELSINKGNEEIRRTYTDENGRYVFSDVEEGKYTIKVEEENYELKEIKEVEVIGGITENIIVKKIKPYEIEVKKYISKIKLNNNGKEIEYEYGKLNKVNQTVKNLKNLSGEIEYKIEIKNTGEKSGEITKIEEEVTEGLKFDKEKNSEWEEKNGKIINRSLEGIKLKAGEEKEITLKLDIEKTDEARSYLQKVTAKGEVYQNVVYILGGKEYKKEKVLDGEKIEEPNINQENFKGWYTDKNYTNKYNFENSVTKDIILYGKIEESTKKYTVQYIDEGKIIKEEELEEGSIINAPEVTKEGYTFIGWYEGEKKYDVYEPITRNLILESKYEINKYKVRFINEDESVLQEEILDYGSIPIYKKETPTKTRTEEYTYEFDKWTPEIIKVTSDQEYKATYKKTKNKYTITYINEGTEYHKEILEYGSVITSIQDPTKEGHTFTGWYTKDNEKVSYPITITKNITLYSKYEINSYKVSYYNEGKKYIDDQKINYGENALKPNTDPSKIGYTFKYWSLKEDGEEYEFSTKITKDITLYAVYEINKYTVTYINEGIEYHKETAEYGSVITSIQNPTKEGYTFTGWYTKDNEKVSYPITVTEDITLYSKYEINSYKVSYYNEGKKYIEDQKINYGENALKPNTNPSKIGYTFKYWSLKENGEEYEFSTKITKDITLYAVYEINKYTLTYINEGIEYHKETAEYGSVITSIQDPIKEGYTFIGWYDENNQKVSYPITVTEDITLHSKYEINTYTVSFYHNNEKYVENQKVNYGESAVKPSTDPTKEDYNFSGWVIKGTNNKYDFTSNVTKDIELESSFTAKPTYTVTFKIENEVILTENVIEGHKVTSKEAPYKKGYLFDKWYSDEELTIENNFNEKIMNNKTIYGKYNENKHTVTYINEGTTYYTEEVLDSFTAKGPSTNPSKEGYTFKYFSKDKKVAFDYNAEITEDATLYAVYEINKYTVTYINEESEYHKEELTYGSKHEKIEDPFKTGYTFIGWYNENEEKVEYPITVTKDITLHSKYEINKYTVTYINEGAKYIEDQQINYKEKAVKPEPNPSKIGYTFKYWSLKENGEEYTFNSEITKNITLYAVYEINKYTVTYINEESEYHKEELTYGSKHEKIEDPFKTGYTFIGWYNENEEKVEYPITVTKDITLHSKYEINKYTVTYINEGAKYIEDQQINYKEKAVKPEPNPSKIGYTFKYWSLKENGEEYIFNSEITKDTTLYAVYNINKYTVTFKNYDGSTLQEETLEYGTLPVYKGEIPTREKTKEYTYTFKGWDKEITEVTNNQEYIATYTETKNKYNVKFTNYNGSILQEETLEYGTLPVYKGEIPTREKTEEYTYTFKSWNKEITEVTDNEIYIAVYREEKNKYTVIYMDGENEYTRKEVNYGETVSEEVISKDHNIYRGWTLDGNIYDFNTPVTKNITINSSFELVESPVIESTPIEWTKENVKVTISSSHNDYSYMYKIDDGEYQNYNGEFAVDKNCTVIAKSIKENVESEITTKEITNIDKVLPEIKELTEENITTKSFDIKVKGQDNESGLSEIRIYKNDELMVSYPYTERLNEEKEETYSLTGLEENTTYKIKAELIDKVGNINVSEEKEITTLKRVIVSRIIGRNNSLYESEEEYEPFESLENAITSCGSNECTIEMVLDTNESVNVLEGQEIKLELNGKTVTGIRDYTIENSGELIIDNDQEIGSITNTNGIGIKNIGNGILQIGENEEPLSVSTTKPNIVGTTYGIYTEEETAKLKFYDGKIEGNVAIQGNVDDTPYLYNAKITNEGHQVATLSILAEAEAKITGGKYYTKLTNAVSESKTGTYKEEEQNIMSTVVNPGLYGFDYDEETNSLISNNTKIPNVSANSYIKLDLTNYENDQKITIDSLVSTYRHYGYVTITKNRTIPEASNTNGRIIYITAENSENSAQATAILEKGNIYYLHLGYQKSSSYNDYTNNDDIFKITNITLVDYQKSVDLDFSKDLVTPGEYGFTYYDGVLESNNKNIDNTTANSYIKVDLTNYLEDQKLHLEANVSSEQNCDYGYITITDSETVPSYNSELGRVVYMSGGISEKYTITLKAGKVNYIHFGYRKDGSRSYGTDTFIVKNFGIYNEIKDSITSNVKTYIPVLNEQVDTVELVKDVTLSLPIEVGSTKEMILDLNGKTLTTTANDYVIKNSGDLTIIDSKYQKDTEKYQADYEAEQEKYDNEYNKDLEFKNIKDEKYKTDLEEYYKELEKYNSSLSVIDFDYTGYEQEYVVPEDGIYTLETWGAQGGDIINSYLGGYGGYSVGTVSLKKGDILYLNVGGQGYSSKTMSSNTKTTGGYNGGGYGYQTTNLYASGGGGATHIATKSGLLSTLSDSLDSILIVSGGGSGAYGYGSYFWNGNSGGGVIGGYSNDSTSAGTQTSGFEFGQAGDSENKSNWASTTNRSGGGGGLYGGQSYWGEKGSGGGSGYIGNSRLTNKVMYCYNCKESNDESTKTVSTTNVSSYATANSAKIGNGHARISKEETQQSNTTKFDYTGNEQEYVAPETGTYKLETWGASGGNATNTYIGGYGGYSSGYVTLNKGDVLYINVGETGKTVFGSNCNNTGTYNGGGSCYVSDGLGNLGESYGSGGGATHIATKSGILSILSSSIDSILIVSGGGGGGEYYNHDNQYISTASGGSAGGFVGNDSYSLYRVFNSSIVDVSSNAGKGGSQSEDLNSNMNSKGSFGMGAVMSGSGYYGGSSNDYGGGGGSSYIGNSKLSNKQMYCYNCKESNDESTKTISTTNVSETPTTNYAKIGNGYAKITKIDNTSSDDTIPIKKPEKPLKPVNGYTTDDYAKDNIKLQLDGIDNIDTSKWSNLSDNSNDGTINGATKQDTGYYFDGSNDYVSFKQMNYDNVTVEATITPQISDSSERDIIANYEGGGYGLHIKNGYINAEFYINNSYRAIQSLDKYEIGKTYIVQATYDGKEMKLYINNKLQNTISITGTIGVPTNNTVIMLGSNPRGTSSDGYYFKGTIHSVRVYDGALTADELYKNYNSDEKRFIGIIRKEATLKEAILTGKITSSTNSIIYNDMNANLTLKEGILELNKSGEYNAITNDGTLSVLENSSINTKQANNRGIYNGYNANIKDGGTTINQSSSGYGIYSVSKVDDGFSDITFNLNSGVGFYNAYGNIVVNNIKTTGSNGAVYTNTGTLTINDSSLASKIVTNGTVTINNSTHILNNYSYDITDDFSGALTLNNCDFQYNIRYYAIWGRSNTLNINNSTITISHSEQYETSIRGVSNLNISNSNITRTGGRYGWRLLDGDNITIKGNSTINSNLFGIVAKNLVIGEKDGVVTEYPYITTGIDGISESENVYIYDGTINSPEGLSLKGTVTEIEDDYELSITKNNNREILTLIKPENAVASIDEKQYLTLQSALDDVSSGQTIKLLDNIFPTKKLNLKDNANFSIDLNKHTIRSFYKDWLFENNGTLSIIDSNTSEKGTIYNNIGKLFKNNGTLELNNISIYSVDKNSYNGTNFLKNRIIENNNELKINKLNTNITTSVEAIYNNENATTTINDSTLGLDAKIVNDNIMNVNNTTINGGNLINNSGKTLNMDKSTAYMNVNNYGIYNSNGSSYTSSFSNNSGGVFVSKGDNYTTDISNSGQLDLYDVNTTSWKSMSNNSSGVINIYSGTINTFVYNDNTSTLNIYDGTIASRITNNNQAIVNFIGGIITSANWDSIINNSSGTINIGTKDGTVNLDSPTITTNAIGVTNNANGKLNFYDGKITGATAISGPVTEVEDGYDIIKETIDGKEVKYLAKQAVAQIESTDEKYNTIQEAIDAVTNTGETIKLLRELTTISSTSTITVPEDKDIILDLNGYKILQNNTPFITNNGTFTLKDSAETTTDSNGYTVYSGTITSSVGNVIENNGTFNYDGGTITSSNGIDGLIINNGLATMNGGYLTSIGWSTNLILNKGDFTINNGYIISASYSNKSINNSGTLTINDGTFKAVTGNNGSGNMSYIINNTGNTNVYGGTVQIDFDYYRPFGFINNESSGNVIIDGLTNVLSSPVNFINNIGTAKISNSTIIGRIYNSGTMDLINLIVNNTSQRNGIYNSTGTLNIHSGEYNVYTENNGNGTMNIIDGTFISGVSNTSTGTINIGTKGDLTEEGELNVSKTNPNITNSNGYGLTISNGKVNFYDGIISGTSGAISGTVNEIEDGYEIISGKTEDGKESKYLALLPVAKIVSTNEEYYNLQDAIDAVTKTGETIKIIRKYTTLNTLETITIPEDKNIIIDLNGYTIEQNNENFLVNNGTLKITDSSENNTSSILMNKNKFIENNKDLTIENIKISTENISLTNAITNNSNMIMKNSNISGKIVSNIINNIGTLNMKNSSITITAGGQGNGINNSGTLTMEDSSLTLGLAGNMKIGVNNSGTLNITNGNYSVSNYYDGTKSEVYYNTGKINITGGTYNLVEHGIMLISNSEKDSKIDGITLTSSYEETIVNRGSGTLDIENSTITSVDSSGSGIVNLKAVIISNSVLRSYDKGTINVYGATINGGRIENNSLINIYDINLNLTNDTIRNYGTVNVYGGTLVSSETSPITNYNNNGVINIGTKDGNVSTEAPVITGKTYGVSNSDSGKVNFYDGIVSGETGAFYGTVNEVEPGYKVVTNKVDTLTSATLALVGDDEKVAVLNGINFSSLQDAINSASDTTESIITLYANIVFDSNITVPANKNIKLYLNGYTLNKGSYDFTGEGKITVIDGTSTNALASIIENVKEVLNIGGIKKNIIIYEMDDGSAISSESTYKLYKDNEEVMLEEDAIGIYSVGNSNDEIRSANKKIYINELPKGKYKLIGDNNKEVKFEIDESGKIIGNVKENTKETSKIVSTAVAELIIMIQTGIEKVNYIMIILTLLVTISSLLYIVKKVNVRES